MQASMLNACVKIQAGWRGKECRSNLIKESDCAKRIQATWRKKRDQDEYQAVLRSALRIKRHWVAHYKRTVGVREDPLVVWRRQTVYLAGISQQHSSIRAIRAMLRNLNAAAVTAASQWPRVMTTRVGLLAVSDNASLDRDSQTFTLLDAPAASFNDGRARQVFTQTIALRGNLSN